MDIQAEARATLQRLSEVISRLGLKQVPLTENVLGVGVALAWADDQFLVVGVPSGSPHSAYISSGVLKDVGDVQLGLRLVNDRNQANPAMTFFIHEAEAGPDVLLQQLYPAELLIEVPQFFSSCLEPSVQLVSQARSVLTESGLGGAPYSWQAGDVDTLLIRSFV